MRKQYNRLSILQATIAVVHQGHNYQATVVGCHHEVNGPWSLGIVYFTLNGGPLK